MSDAIAGPSNAAEAFGAELDARGLLCPLPVIRTAERVNALAAGEELVVRASDPGAAHDIPAWCRVHGHELIACETDARDEVTVRLRVGAPA